MTPASRSLRLFNPPRLSFLVFASPKSGTTWLQRLLSSHSETLCAESRAFGDYYAANPLADPHLTVEKYVGVLSKYYAPAIGGLQPSDTSFYRHVLFNTLDAVAETSLRATGKRTYGEKLTPYRATAAHAVEVLREYNPGVRFINLVRDGRDVIVSGASQWLNLRLRRAAEDERGIYERAIADRVIPDAEFEMFLDHWTDAVSTGLAARDLFPHYLDLRYETFLANPMAAARTLFEFVGADAGDLTVGRAVAAASFKVMSGGREPGTEDAHSFFRKGVSGDWKDWFSDAQLDVFERRAGELMRAAGY